MTALLLLGFLLPVISGFLLTHLLWPARQISSLLLKVFLGMGLGFLGSQPSASSATVYHQNEFGLEATYVLQLTPMAKLQSDFQAIWDPAYNPGARHAFVFQVQLALAW